MIKRYLLFKVYLYEPGGGWEDFVKASDNIEELRSYVRHSKYNTTDDLIDVKFEIVDLEKLSAVEVHIPNPCGGV